MAYTLPRLLLSRTVPRFSEMYPDLAGSGTLPSAVFSAPITFRSSKGHQNPNLPAVSKQWQPALLLRRAVLPKNTKTPILPLKHTVLLERTVATESATKGHTNPNLPAWQPTMLV